MMVQICVVIFIQAVLLVILTLVTFELMVKSSDKLLDKSLHEQA